MKKLDKTVKKETLYISAWVLILSAIMEAVFLLILGDKFNYQVPLGNLLGAITAIGNFLLLGITVQKVLNKPEDKVKSTMRVSQAYRLFIVAAVIILGCIFHNKAFNMWAVIIPLIFPRIAIAFRPLFNKQMGDYYPNGKTPVDNEAQNEEVEE